HRINVASDHISVGPAIDHFEIHRRVEGVREAVLEHPGQLLVAHASLHGFDGPLHSAALEFAPGFRGADHRKVSLGPPTHRTQHGAGGEKGGVANEVSSVHSFDK